MSSIARPQDLPPPGGYQKIPFTRNPAKKILTGKILFCAHAVMTLTAIYLYKQTDRENTREKIEMRSGLYAMAPLLVAERDRTFLKQLRKNRDAERELMKNVEGWKVGTWYGTPVFFDESEYVEPHLQEYFVHCSLDDVEHRLQFNQWH